METDEMRETGETEQERYHFASGCPFLSCLSEKKKTTTSEKKKGIRYARGKTESRTVGERMSEGCTLMIPQGERFAICLNPVCSVLPRGRVTVVP